MAKVSVIVSELVVPVVTEGSMSSTVAAVSAVCSGSVSGVVSLGSVCFPPSWLGVRSSSVRTSTIGSLDSSFEKAALPSSMSLPLAPGPDLPHKLTAMHMSRPHLFRK